MHRAIQGAAEYFKISFNHSVEFGCYTKV